MIEVIILLILITIIIIFLFDRVKKLDDILTTKEPEKPEETKKEIQLSEEEKQIVSLYKKYPKMNFLVSSGLTLGDIIIESSKKYGIDPKLIIAHIIVESSWDINAVNPNDPSYGLMGISTQLAQDYGLCRNWRSVTKEEIEKIKNPSNNIDAGTRFLSYLHRKYSFDIATQMYNCGETGYKNGVRVPEYLARIKKHYTG